MFRDHSQVSICPKHIFAETPRSTNHWRQSETDKTFQQILSEHLYACKTRESSVVVHQTKHKTKTIRVCPARVGEGSSLEGGLAWRGIPAQKGGGVPARGVLHDDDDNDDADVTP